MAAAAGQLTAVSGTSVGSRKTPLQDLTRWLLDLSQRTLHWKPLAAMTIVFVLGMSLFQMPSSECEPQTM